ncbi:MAG: hypothetical protein ACP5GY_06065 [Vulcanisaeta sp.]
MIVLRSNKLKDIILELGNKLNEILQFINEIHAFNPDNELINKLSKELRGKSAVTSIKGNSNITSKANDLEVIYVLTADGYKNIMRDAINYFTNILMSIKQVIEFTEKLGIVDEYAIFIDDSSVDVIIGFLPPDMSEMPLLHLPSIRESVEIQSVLGNITGLSAEELDSVMKLIDELLSSVKNNLKQIETTIEINNISYPDPFRKIEEEVGGA